MEELPVTVARFGNEYELVLAKGMLESAGLECFVSERAAAQMEAVEALGGGTLELQVWPRDAAIAREMLNGVPYDISDYQNG